MWDTDPGWTLIGDRRQLELNGESVLLPTNKQKQGIWSWVIVRYYKKSRNKTTYLKGANEEFVNGPLEILETFSSGLRHEGISFESRWSQWSRKDSLENELEFKLSEPVIM
jgi:hypothetical protein